jgi:hypothetical protein
MPPADVRLAPSTLIDISHESLIRGWERLRQWVVGEFEAAKRYRRLAETAVLWEAGRAGLLRDPELAHMREWWDRDRPVASWGAAYHSSFATAAKFLERSRSEQERERQLESAQIAARRRRRRLTFAALAAGLVVTSALSVFAWQKSKVATAEARRANELKERASSEAKRAEESARVAEDNARKAANSAKEAEREKSNAEAANSGLKKALAQASVALAAERRATTRAEEMTAKEREAQRQAGENLKEAKKQEQEALRSKENAEKQTKITQKHRKDALDYIWSVLIQANGLVDATPQERNT